LLLELRTRVFRQLQQFVLERSGSKSGLQTIVAVTQWHAVGIPLVVHVIFGLSKPNPGGPIYWLIAIRDPVGASREAHALLFAN
jgi:hypothetical protein